jgi:hypothetical protein
VIQGRKCVFDFRCCLVSLVLVKKDWQNGRMNCRADGRTIKEPSPAQILSHKSVMNKMHSIFSSFYFIAKLSNGQESAMSILIDCNKIFMCKLSSHLKF